MWGKKREKVDVVVRNQIDGADIAAGIVIGTAGVAVGKGAVKVAGAAAKGIWNGLTYIGGKISDACHQDPFDKAARDSSDYEDSAE